MKSNQYKNAIVKTLAFKESKVGLRTMMRKRSNLWLGHALVGINSEWGEFMESITPFILGHQLSDTIRVGSREEFGDYLYYLSLAAKVQGLYLPSSSRKSGLKGVTLTQAIMTLNSGAKELLSLYKKVYYGKELDHQKIDDLLKSQIILTWQFCNSFYGEPPQGLMVENIAKLQKRFGGSFSVEAINKKEAAEAEAASAAE